MKQTVNKDKKYLEKQLEFKCKEIEYFKNDCNKFSMLIDLLINIYDESINSIVDIEEFLQLSDEENKEDLLYAIRKHKQYLD